jgi:sulfur relay protein TusB/DsrH
LLVLAEDLAAQGVSEPAAGIRSIDYRDWVQLAADHAQQQVWA